MTPPVSLAEAVAKAKDETRRARRTLPSGFITRDQPAAACAYYLERAIQQLDHALAAWEPKPEGEE